MLVLHPSIIIILTFRDHHPIISGPYLYPGCRKTLEARDVEQVPRIESN